MPKPAVLFILFVLIFCCIQSASPGDLVKVTLTNETATVSISQEQRLQIVSDTARGVPFQLDLPEVTDFKVCLWIGDGLFLVVEAEEFPETRSYVWMTLLPASKVMQKEPLDGQSHFLTIARGHISGSTKPLQILEAVSPGGDSVVAYLLDKTPIPETDRKLVISFRHDCPRIPVLNMGVTDRLFLTPEGIARLRSVAGPAGSEVK